MLVRWVAGVTRAAPLLDAQNRIEAAEVDLSPSCTFLGQFLFFGRAKCNVFDRFGRALHAMQDFYAHSNWADAPRPGRITINNPPGLNRALPIPLLDMRRLRMPPVPATLTTGCFEVRELVRDTPKACVGRIRHKILNKDNGSIRPARPATGADPNATGTINNAAGLVVGASAKPRGQIGTNFQKAVLAAVRETRRQWRHFRGELIARYGSRRGTLMICALTRDDPVRDCQGRKLAIVIDSSGSNADTDPANLRTIAGMTFNARLVTAAQAGPDSPSDRSAVIDFDDSARIVSPLGDPSLASFAEIDSSGGTNIASGLNLAVEELTRDPGDPTAGRSGIVVLTDGQDATQAALIAAINRARDLEIRVSFGFLASPTNSAPARPARAATAPPTRVLSTDHALAGSTEPPPLDLVTAILETGGFYGTIDSAEAQESFINIVENNGATGLDDPNGADDGGALEPGVDVSGRVGNAKDSDTWTFSAKVGRLLHIRLTGLDGQDLTVSARDVERGRQLLRGSSSDGEANIRGRFRKSSRIEIEVGGKAGQPGAYTIGLTETGVDLRGTKRANRLRCGPSPTYVLAGAGNDRVTCAASNDMIVGGPGADNLKGGKGDDIFLVLRRDLRRGIERINGGAGNDVVEFSFRKPRRLRCAGRKRIVVPISRRSGWILTNVEAVTFNGRRC